MKKAVLIFLFFASWILFQFQGCGDEINNIIAYDTTAVIETNTVFINNCRIIKESDARILSQSWIYCYSNNSNTNFHIDTSYIYGYNDSLIAVRGIDVVISENCMWLAGYHEDGDFQHITANDSLLIKIDYRIIELLGVSDTGFVYEVLRDSTTSRWAPVIPG